MVADAEVPHIAVRDLAVELEGGTLEEGALRLDGAGPVAGDRLRLEHGLRNGEGVDVE